MIQRIQTLWLLLGGLILLGLFIFPYLNYIDPVGLGRQVLVTGVYSSVNNEAQKIDSHLLQSIATILVAAFPLFIIFMFKNRKLQIKLIYIQIVLVVLLGIWLFTTASQLLSTMNRSIHADSIGVGLFLLPIAVLFFILAIRGIQNDEKLIRSADRLR